jgi:hypothetical protein
MAQFKARLTPHTVDCSCISVREYVGGSGSDSCWFPGSIFPPWTAITGRTWSVDSDNWYEPDLIGWYTERINYYRASGRAPCHNVMIQDMKVLGAGCGSSYKQNQLEAHIGTSTLTSKRDGVSTTRNW